MLTTYTYDAANQLLTSEDDSGVTTYTYDAEGNRTRKETPTAITDYTWDEDNRMILAEPVAGDVSFTYNADGQRVRKETTTDTTKFIYDFKKLLQETDGSDAAQESYTATLQEYGDLVSEHDESSGSTSYPQYDALGSTDALVDENESTTDTYRYRAFGLATHETGSSETPHTFVGRQNYYHDPEIELYYLGMGGGRAEDGATEGRLYAPDIGAFIQKDRVETVTSNLYDYVGNNPINAIDSSGLEPQEQLVDTVEGIPVKYPAPPNAKIIPTIDGKRGVPVIKFRDGCYYTTKVTVTLILPYDVGTLEEKIKADFDWIGSGRTGAPPHVHRTTYHLDRRVKDAWIRMPESQVRALGLEGDRGPELPPKITRFIADASGYVTIVDLPALISDVQAGVEPNQALYNRKGDLIFSMVGILVGGVVVKRVLGNVAKRKVAQAAGDIAEVDRLNRVISDDIEQVLKSLDEATNVAKEGVEASQKHIDAARKFADAIKAEDEELAKTVTKLADEAQATISKVIAAGLPAVRKAVNSDIIHASEQAVRRGVFPDTNSAANALRELSKKITSEGLPPGTIPDPRRADSVLVPFGVGHAVYEVTKKGTAVLRTVLGKGS